MAHIRQSRPDSGLDLQVKVLTTCSVVPSSLGSSTIKGSGYRGISLIRNCLLLGTYSRPVPRALGWSWGGGVSYERGTPVVSRD